MTEEKIILADDQEAAKKVTETFWKSSRGHYFLKEDAARYDGSTHFKCECGEISKKRCYTVCESCHSKLEAERFSKLEKKKWDGKDQICLYRGDKYFYSYDDLDDYCAEIYDEEIEPQRPDELMLVHCKPTKSRELNSEFFEALFPDDDSWDLPKDIYDAMDEFNQTVKDNMPLTWEPSNIAVIF